MSEHLPIKGSSTPNVLHSIFSLMRSGHHAVIDWLQAGYHASGSSASHVNSVFERRIWSALSEPPPPTATLSAQNVLLQAGRVAVIMANYEDTAYGRRFDAPPYVDPLWETLGVERRDSIVVRDWYDVLASRMQKIENFRSRNMRSAVAELAGTALAGVWQEHAEGLTGSMATPSYALYINYNKWATDPDYRRAVADRYAIPSIEEAVQRVPASGQGSSFDFQSYDGNASQMNVLHRWQDLHRAVVPAYTQAVHDTPARVEELNYQLFGFGADQVLASVNSSINEM